jgi:hypothetical protein
MNQHMTSSTDRSIIILFRPVLTAGIIIISFGIICVWIGSTTAIITSPKEELDGFRIIGWRFLIGGIILISLAYTLKYYMTIKYLWKQLQYKRKPEQNKFSDWYKP